MSADVLRSPTWEVDFGFIDDEALRTLVCSERALSRAVQRGTHPESRALQEEILAMGLAKLIDRAVGCKLLGKSAKAASWAVKDFRNFIHRQTSTPGPGREHPEVAQSLAGPPPASGRGA